MFLLNLGFDVQGIAKLDASGKLIIGDRKPFSEVKFNSYGAYIRETGNEKPKQGTQIGCGKFNYEVSKEYAFVYFDFVEKYTLDSVKKTVFSQLNQKKIEITDIKSDFATIKNEEGLKELKDGALLKITFESTYEFINDCDGLVCVC